MLLSLQVVDKRKSFIDSTFPINSILFLEICRVIDYSVLHLFLQGRVSFFKMVSKFLILVTIWWTVVGAGCATEQIGCVFLLVSEPRSQDAV